MNKKEFDVWRDWLVPQRAPRWQALHDPTFKQPTPEKPEGDFVITASRVPDFIGVGNHSKQQAFRLMTGLEEWKDEDNQFMKWGRDHEAEAVLDFKKKCFALDEHNPYFEVTGVTPGMKYHDKYHWLGASLDQMLLVENGALQILEIKCPFPMEGSKPVTKDPNDLKANYLVQVQIQMAVFGPYFKKAILYIWKPDGASAFKVPRNDAFIDYLIEKTIEFKDSCSDVRNLPKKKQLDPEFLSLLQQVKSKTKLLF